MDMPEELTVNGVRYIRADAAEKKSSSSRRVERWYTVAELAEMSGLSKSTINAAIRDKRISAKTPNGGTRYRRVSESEWLRFTASLT